LSVSEELFTRAKRVLPGGVNSPVRAFGAVGGTPRFISGGRGSRITDADGAKYIDYVCSWGPLILGHNHPQIREAVERAVRRGLSFGAPCEDEVNLAELMCEMVSGLETVRMTSSGTEAVMSAVRVARRATGREKLIKFEGCYHGHSDAMLVKAGSGALTFGKPDSGGVPASSASLTLTAGYNNLLSVAALFDANPREIAAVIVEPVAANMGVVVPADGFLEGLRKLCDKNGALLIFDEVITGFRLARGGAQEKYGVAADLVTFGKIIGGGMPVGAFGGRRELMANVAPLGDVYQAGTLSGNPVAMAAGLAQLRYLNENPEVYAAIDGACAELATAVAEAAKRVGIPVTINRVGSLMTVFFTREEVTDFGAASRSDGERYAAWFHAMLRRGIYLPPSRYEAMFVSAAHARRELDRTVSAARASFKELL
jgi:glutamate-1-semialdehyde 2,1-aminomutase